MKAAEERAREISKATFSERNKLLQDAMKSELSLGHQDQLSNLRQLGLYGAHGQKEFGDTLGHLRDVNKHGSTKWANEQAENEELYKNYQNEGAWEWPHLRGQARRQALGDVFRGLENRNISLDNVANINTNYSELQKERDALRASYSSERDNYGRRLADLTRDLNTSQGVRTDLERQLGQLTAQQAAQRQAEQQRQTQLAQQQAEQQRQAQLAQQQRDAQQKAAAAAEAQRLAGLKKESVRDWQNMWANALKGVDTSVDYSADWKARQIPSQEQQDMESDQRFFNQIQKLDNAPKMGHIRTYAWKTPQFQQYAQQYR
jgi:pyruvate/2-oxoglutarate dehydrogenase complex dihydrolipoamide acyltransferase (E2) component